MHYFEDIVGSNSRNSKNIVSVEIMRGSDELTITKCVTGKSCPLPTVTDSLVASC